MDGFFKILKKALSKLIPGLSWKFETAQRVPIISKSSKFKGATQHYVSKLPKSVGAKHYCPKIPPPVLTQALNMHKIVSFIKRGEFSA